jgi:lysophospholipase L1-like esterase
VSSTRPLSFSFFGTSIMEHREAYSPRLHAPYDLPEVGQAVVIEAHRKRGWVHTLYLGLQVAWPSVRFAFDNRGLGGATSRDVLRIVTAAASAQPGPDVAILGVGINDVWRCFQGRPELAVHPPEYHDNYQTLLEILTGWARTTICLTETPFGWDETLDVAAMNRQLADYNTVAARIAGRHGVQTVELWNPLLALAAQSGSGLSPWSDGAHLSELGDTLVARLVGQHLVTTATLVDLLPPITSCRSTVKT